LYPPFIILEGNLPKPGNPYPFGGKKPGNPYCGPTNQQPTTNRLTAEELKYSHNRALRRQRLTTNLLEVWQNSAPFGGRLISATIEALLTKVLNWQSSDDHRLFFM
jgi:hypothetical protein